ncbi:hypothetical protein SUGI_0447190 [Cryptomeria japonica]|uniref:OVARIAN TUMOR DOMAIN-containing deubiquitinating enzyme 7 isoform X2 n=1 Tax=Cryptomeria japonica TaxID=3369 RepID=UPI002408EFC8|nr:OVARIAN TUMOR DOMAIN-containing deubiquitinating enzyme 7 isoform X2 [Cryptomeria japonica]GLJ23613.1 hypothetical protein SUGI_0447190 [Cryptomeria japonica]
MGRKVKAFSNCCDLQIEEDRIPPFLQDFSMARVKTVARAKPNILPEPENHQEGKDKDKEEEAKAEEEEEVQVEGEGEVQVEGKLEVELEEEEEEEDDIASTRSVGQGQESVEQSKDNGDTEEEEEEVQVEGEGEGEMEVEEEEEDEAASTSSVSQGQKSVEQSKNNVDGFRAQLSQMGLRIVDIRGDGNCLFRALSDQLCGDQESYAEYRQKVVQYMVSHPEEFAGFLSEGEAGSFEEYCTKMSQDAEWGGNLELQAASMAFFMNIRVYRFDQGQVEISDINNFETAGTLLLSYHNGTHYNSLQIKDCDSSEDEERAAYRTEERMKDSEEHDNDSGELIMFAPGSTGADLIEPMLQQVDGDTAAAVDKILKELTSTMDSAKNDEGEIEDPPYINNDPQRNSRKRKIHPDEKKD